jgi:UDP-N-acetylmuramoyl-tripeptide--D-alanyl-D-alanine ligase
MRMTAREIAGAVDGELLGRPDAEARAFAIDTRQLDPGSCFVALTAERDGHDFVDDAWARGATVALVGREVATPSDRASVRVVDPSAALSALGAAARARLSLATVVGITGSAGKTATKDLLAAAVGTTLSTHSSPASFNNEAGVPLTLLGAAPDAEVVVVEMGARFAGNIASLCAIARPYAGVITNIGLAHAGLLEGRAGVARAKGELLERLPAAGLAVLEADADFTTTLRARTVARVLLVGGEGVPGADVRATAVRLDDELRPSFELQTPWGSTKARLGLRGEHQVANALMAAAVAGDLGVPLDQIAAGLGEARAAPWRMELVRAPSGIAVLNDSYNASPTSTAAALRALARLSVPGRRLAVLGEMRELGDHAAREHATIGRLAAEAGVSVLVVVGEGARGMAEGALDGSGGRAIRVIEVLDAAAAGKVVAQEVEPGDAVLVKASRAIGLERVAESLTGVVVEA